MTATSDAVAAGVDKTGVSTGRLLSRGPVTLNGNLVIARLDAISEDGNQICFRVRSLDSDSTTPSKLDVLNSLICACVILDQPALIQGHRLSCFIECADSALWSVRADFANFSELAHRILKHHVGTYFDNTVIPAPVLAWLLLSTSRSDPAIEDFLESVCCKSASAQ